MTNVFATPQKGTGAEVSAGHEQVTFCQDMQSGLHAIVAIYSTALGPALGGTRFYPYRNRGRRPGRRAQSRPGDGL